MPEPEDKLTERQLAKESYRLLAKILSELQKQNAADEAARRAAMIPVDEEPIGSPTGGLTNSELRAVPVDVLGPLTNTELRAAAISVTVTGTVTTTIGLTDTQLRASPVTVQFGSAQAITVAALPLPAGAATEATLGGLLTDTQLRASPVSISGTVLVGGVVEIANDSGSAIPISVATLPLPSGAATEATVASLLTLSGFQARVPVPGQAAMAASIPVVIANNQSALPVTGAFFQATQPVSAASLPLPAGASTEATLGTMLTLSGFQARIPVQGQALMAASVPVTLASNQSALAVTGAFFQATQPVSAASLPLPTGAATESTLGNLLTTSAFQARVPVLGQGLMAASMPVTIASNQSAFPVTGSGNFAITAAALPLPTGAATETTLGTMLTLAGFQARIPANGQGTMAASIPVVLSSNHSTIVITGSTAAGSPSATNLLTVQGHGSGTPIPMSAAALPLPTGAATETTLAALNAKFGALGQAAMAASVSVTLANNQSNVPGNIVQLAGTAISLNTGVRDAGTQRVTIATNDIIPVSQSGAWVVSGSAVNPSTAMGKSIVFVAVNQGAAGTTVLAGASPGNKAKIIGASLTLSAAGTIKFTDGVGDLSGPMDIVASGGFVLPPSIIPHNQTSTSNTPLNLVTTGGAARGFVALLIEA